MYWNSQYDREFTRGLWLILTLAAVGFLTVAVGLIALAVYLVRHITWSG